MIKPQELRIGNKVKCSISNDAGIYEVLGIPMWGMDGQGDGKEPLILIDRCPKQLVPPSKLKPISITHEILEKIGFKWLGGDHYEWAENNNLWLEDYRGEYRLVRSIFCPTLFKHLHQLQNLYFALTRTELEINL